MSIKKITNIVGVKRNSTEKYITFTQAEKKSLSQAGFNNVPYMK